MSAASASASVSASPKRSLYATLHACMDHALVTFGTESLPPSLALVHTEMTLVDAYGALQEIVASRTETMERRERMLLQAREEEEDEDERRRRIKRKRREREREREKQNREARVSSSGRDGEDTAAIIKAKTKVGSRATPPPSPGSVSISGSTTSAVAVAAEGSVKRKKTKMKKVKPIVVGSPRPRTKAKSSVQAKAKADVPPPRTVVKRLDLSGATQEPVIVTEAPVRDIKKKAKSVRTSPTTPTTPERTSDSTFAKLTELPLLDTLQEDSKKHKVLIKWLDADRGKNDTLSNKFLKQLQRVLKTTGSTANTTKASPLSRTKSSPPRTNVKEYASLDEVLRKEGYSRRGRRRQRSDAQKKSGPTKRSQDNLGDFVVDGSDEDMDEGVEYEGDSEDEYVRAESSSSDEAEFMPTVEQDRSRNGKSKSTKTTPTKGSNGITGRQQLAKVLEKLDLEENKSTAPTYLSYTTNDKKKSSKTKQKLDGSSEFSAIVLEDSDDEEDENDKEEEEEKPAPRTSSTNKKAQPQRSSKIEAESEDDAGDNNQDNEVDDDDSSTDAEQDVFDLNEEDVYVVESILEMKRGRPTLVHGKRTQEPNIFLVKWEGWDEVTWEPEANIPKRLIDAFQDRMTGMDGCEYAVERFTERRVVTNSTTNRREIIYLVQWRGQERSMWEVQSNLPQRAVTWLEKMHRSGGNGSYSTPARKKIKR